MFNRFFDRETYERKDVEHMFDKYVEHMAN